MNALVLKRQIEALLGLAGPDAERFWRIAWTNSSTRPTPSGPIPVPYPNIGAGAAVPASGSGFDGKYRVTSVRHIFGGSHLKDLTACVIGAATGDSAAQRVWPLWLRVKAAISRQPAHARSLLAHELAHVMQQQGRRR